MYYILNITNKALEAKLCATLIQDYMSIYITLEPIKSISRSHATKVRTNHSWALAHFYTPLETIQNRLYYAEVNKNICINCRF